MVSRIKYSVGTYFRIRTNTARNYHQMVGQIKYGIGTYSWL